MAVILCEEASAPCFDPHPNIDPDIDPSRSPCSVQQVYAGDWHPCIHLAIFTSRYYARQVDFLVSAHTYMNIKQS